MLVHLSGEGPLYQQVYRALRESILAGRAVPGSPLPATRMLARDLRVSRNVVLIAYEQLAAEGYAEGRVGSGTYVSAALSGVRLPAAVVASAVKSNGRGTRQRLSRYAHRILAAPGRSAPIYPTPARKPRYDFQFGLAAVEDAPLQLWRRLIARRARHLSLDYGRSEGHASLQGAIADYLRRSRAVNCEAGQVLIVSGSQQALDLACRVLLDTGDAVVIEDPQYHGARDLFKAAGARLLPVSVDAVGLQVHRLPRRAGRVRAIYVTPSHQFPTGAILPLERRLALLGWAAKHHAYILEDDYDGEYRYDAPPVEAMQGLDRAGWVIYVGTFSKVLFPSLRVGYLVLPKPLVAPFARAKWLADWHTPTLQQEVLADFIREGHFERYLRRARQRNAARRAALLAALEKYLGDSVKVSGANAGVHVLVWLLGVASEQLAAVIARAADAGVAVYSVTPFYLRPPRRAGILLGYGAMTEREITEGIRILADAVRSLPSR